MKSKALALAAVLAAGAVFVHPTAAFAGTYTPEAACAKETGRSGWTHVRDNKRAVKTGGSTYGYVYLMWNRSLQKNCVAVIKTSYVGTPTFTQAVLKFEDGAAYRDPGQLTAKKYKYFAAAAGYGKGKCVKYEGYISDTRVDFALASGKRTTWGNCG
ncbi:hypothetical protein ABZ897_45985 [Nonomuraea sp. NPDC046802]|uniref:hypothetical protein n=1 Tax=Nonomuraea sp. NPDC046802 TaxID=3154919 RepID=UPI0033CF9064